jgi:hypothetical protein
MICDERETNSPSSAENLERRVFCFWTAAATNTHMLRDTPATARQHGHSATLERSADWPSTTTCLALITSGYEQNDVETPAQFTARLQDEIFAGHDFVPADRLIPVLHLHAHGDENKRLSEDEILSLVTTIGSQCLSPFVAIPERELGDGLLNKYRLAKKRRSRCPRWRNRSSYFGVWKSAFLRLFRCRWGQTGRRARMVSHIRGR